MKHVQFQQKYVYAMQNEDIDPEQFPIGKLASPPSFTSYFLITHLLYHDCAQECPPVPEAWLRTDENRPWTPAFSEEKMQQEAERVANMWQWGKI